MSDTALRSGLIRLAYQKPNLRSALLPLLKKRAGDGDDMAAVLEAEADPTSHDQNLPEHYYYGKTSKKGSKTSGEREVLRHGSLRAEWEYNSGTTRIYQVYDAQEGAVVGRLLWDKRANSWEVEVADPNSRREWSRVSYFSSPDAREGVKRGLALLAERWADKENERLAEIEAGYSRRSAGGKTAEERLENIEKMLSQFASPKSKNQNKPQSYYGLPPKGKQASVKTAGGSGAANAAFLRQSPLKNKILQAVAKHYGVSVSEIEAELTDPDAEALYEYIGNDRALAMTVYRDMKAKGL